MLFSSKCLEILIWSSTRNKQPSHLPDLSYPITTARADKPDANKQSPAVFILFVHGGRFLLLMAAQKAIRWETRCTVA
jgi:hypothetical protein